jgi:DNA-binding response OmpR family regulator
MCKNFWDLNAYQQRIRQSKEFEEIPVVVLTTSSHESDIIKSLKAVFYNVWVEGSADKVISVFRDFNPDIVFVDILMPHMNGEQFFDEIQNIKNDVPVVFMTGKLELDSNKYLNKGARAFIQKPFNIRDIIDLLKRIFQERGAEYASFGADPVFPGSLGFI